jgi:hypothetical protein
METVMKQAEEAKRTAIESARRAFEDYQPLKHEVDLMRTELLGLEKLPELPEEEKEKLGGLGYASYVVLLIQNSLVFKDNVCF